MDPALLLFATITGPPVGELLIDHPQLQLLGHVEVSGKYGGRPVTVGRYGGRTVVGLYGGLGW